MPVSPVSARLLSIPLRAGQLALAATVAGLVGHYLHDFHHVHAWPYNRFIYTEVVAGLSIILALLWLIPHTARFMQWLIDAILSVAWIVAFGLLVAFVGPLRCGSIWLWGNISEKGMCEEWKAATAFSLISALLWLASALLGSEYMHHTPPDADGARTNGTNAGTSRRKWYRSHNV